MLHQQLRYGCIRFDRIGICYECSAFCNNFLAVFGNTGHLPVFCKFLRKLRFSANQITAITARKASNQFFNIKSDTSDGSATIQKSPTFFLIRINCSKDIIQYIGIFCSKDNSMQIM